MRAGRLNVDTNEFSVRDVPVPDLTAGWVRVKKTDNPVRLIVVP